MFEFHAYKQTIADKLDSLTGPYFRFRLLAIYLGNVIDVLPSPPGAQIACRLDMRMRPALQVQDLAYRYEEGASPVPEGFDLSIASGEIVGITGPTDGDKSMLLERLAGSPARLCHSAAASGSTATNSRVCHHKGIIMLMMAHRAER